jgi:hypothetical protein
MALTSNRAVAEVAKLQICCEPACSGTNELFTSGGGRMVIKKTVTKLFFKKEKFDQKKLRGKKVNNDHRIQSPLDIQVRRGGHPCSPPID